MIVTNWHKAYQLLHVCYWFLFAIRLRVAQVDSLKNVIMVMIESQYAL